MTPGIDLYELALVWLIDDNSIVPLEVLPPVILQTILSKIQLSDTDTSALTIVSQDSFTYNATSGEVHFGLAPSVRLTVVEHV